ncbi:MAG TPA: VCBS domain-containing protein, partial [Burkholderiaceae bacterium]|nr:VCBS domain-containing protein [Burkholderiaceae bacterium]
MSTTTAQILFIDSLVADYATLLQGVDPSIEVVLLDGGVDGLTQIAQTLAGRSGIDAVHIISHGSPGNLTLGSLSLSQDGLASHAAELAAIRDALSEQADFLLYGCNVAEGEVGASFIQALAEATGADVAASIDATGPMLIGENWALEAATGPIESVLPVSDAAAESFAGSLALPGAHHAASGSELFLGGNYIELGISAVGSFGTSGSKPAGFYGTSGTSAIGMSNDADGFGNGKDLRIDYFLPGTPEERWAVGYNGNTTASFSQLNGSNGSLSSTTVTDTTSGSTLGATFASTVNSTLRVSQAISFGVNDKFFKNTVTLTNTTGGTLSDVRFMRSFDPDNTVYYDGGSGYTTTNRVDNTVAASGKAVVSATSGSGSYSTAAGSTAKILYYSTFAGAYGAAFGFANKDPYAAPEQSQGYQVTQDGGISMVFKVGSLAAGQSVTFEYYTSLDTADITTTVAKIEAPANVAPTFGSPVFDAGSTVADTAGNDTFNPLTGHLVATDSDGGTLSYSGSSTGTYGSLVVNSNGTFTFTPNNAAVQGLKSSVTQNFTVSVSDGQGGTTNGTLAFSIAGTNDTPAAVADTAIAVEAGGAANASAGTNPTGNVLSNDTDRDSGDTKAVSDVVYGATHGSVGSALAGAYGSLTLNANGSYTYTVNNGNSSVQGLKSGGSLTDTFTYTVVDGSGVSSQSTLTVTINGANDNPAASNDAGSATEKGGVSNGSAGSDATGNVLGNDSDPDAGDTASLVVNPYTVAGNYGTLTLRADGSYTYAINETNASVQALRTASDTLTDTFSYVAKDVNNLTSTGQLVITLHGADDAPVANDDGGTAVEASGTANGTAGSNGSGNVLSNDTDVDSGDAKTVTAVRTGSVEGSGTSASAGAALVGSYGTLTLNADGSYTYVVNESNATVQALQSGESLVDSFNYTVADTAGATDQARLDITVQGRNDAPEFTSAAASASFTDTANADSFAAQTGTVVAHDVDSASVRFDVRGGVTSGTGASQVSSSSGLYGTLTVKTATGEWTFTPNAVAINALPGGADQVETFEFRVTDAQGASALQTFSVNITHVNDAPLRPDAIEDQIYAGGVWQYQVPAATFTDAEGGGFTFSVQLVDASGVPVDDGVHPAGSLPAWLTFDATTRTFSGTPDSKSDIHLKVIATDAGGLQVFDVFKLTLANHAPAGASTATLVAGTEDSAYYIDPATLLQGFSDADGDTLSIDNPAVDPAQGSAQIVTVSGRPAIKITPAANFNGTVTLTYDVIDGAGGSVSASTSFTLAAVNDAPAGAPSAAWADGTQNTAYSMSEADLLAGFSDVEGDALSAVGVTVDHGTVERIVAGDGSVSFRITPTVGYQGDLLVSYRVSDGNGGFTAATATVTLNAVNHAPALTGARAALAAGTEDTAYTVSATDLLEGFTDADAGDTLGVTGLTADHGSVVDNLDGTFTITPAANYNGKVTLSYGVSDGALTTNTTHTFTLEAVNDAPGGAPAYTMPNGIEDTPYIMGRADLLRGFTDVDGNALSVVNLSATMNVGGASAGSFLQNADLSWTFTPNANVNGQVNLTYQVSDGHGGLTTVNTSFTLTPINDAPTATNLSQSGAYDSASGATVALPNAIVVADNDAGDSITVTLRLVDPAAGTLGSDDGVTTYGTFSAGAWTFTGNAADVNTALATVKFSPAALWASDVAILTTVRDAAHTGPAVGVINLQAQDGGGNAIPASGEVPAATELTQSLTFTKTDPTVALNDIVVDDKGDGDIITVVLALSSPAAGALTTGSFNAGAVTSTYDSDTGIWTVSGLAADVNAALADVAFTPSGTWNSDLTITTLVRDASGAGPAAGAITLTANVVKAAPTSTNDNVGTTVNQTLILSLADFGDYSDPDLGATGPEHWIIITGLPAHGSLEFNQGSAGLPDWQPVVLAADAVHGTGLTGAWIDVADITAGKLRFVPTAGYEGADGLTFRVEKNPFSGEYSLAIDVAGVNDAPTHTGPQADLAAVNEDTAQTISESDLLVGYTDPEGDTMTVTGLTADHGSVTRVVDAGTGAVSFVITPQTNYNGPMALSYNIDDGHGGVTAATQSYTVTAVNDAPVLTSAQATIGAIAEDSPRTIDAADLLQGFTDVEGDTLSVTGLTADHGTVVDNGDGTFTITPTANYNGPVTLSYGVYDGTDTVAASQTYVLIAVNDAPTVAHVLADQSATQDTPFSFTIPSNAFNDVDAGTTLAYSAQLVDGTGALVDTGALPDWLVFNAATGTFSGTPANGDVGTVHVRVTANDGSGGTVTGTFDLTVANTNDAPTVLHPVADQTYSGSGTFSTTLSDVFADADVAYGDHIAYSVTLSDGLPLPDWLTFNAVSGVLSGNPPGGTPYLNITVQGTDDSGAFATSTFTLNLQDTGSGSGLASTNNAGAVAFSGTAAENSTLHADLPTDTDGIPAGASVSYQWQIASAVGGPWSDIAGSRAQSADFTLTQAEVGQYVRVQAFYTDAGGVLESPVSAPSAAIANVNDPGTLSLTGSLTENSLLTATLDDADGLDGVTVTYLWESSTDNSTWTTIAGATGSTYLTTSSEADKYVRVTASYTDAQGSTGVVGGEHAVATSASRILAGATAPVAHNDSGSATEAGGVANATAGSSATGNLLGNDTDANLPDDTQTVASVRLGAVEGLGAPADVVGSDLVIHGEYGTLTVHADGSYSYVVDQSLAAVQALTPAGTALQDFFNYTLVDGTGLIDKAVLTINITGANDAPVAGDNAGSATEASGLANAVAGSNATGDVLTNAGDVDAGASLTIAQVRTGGVEGAGTQVAADHALVGSYGTLTLHGNGTYSYVVNEGSAAVQALQAGQSLSEQFNYTVSDGSLSDIGVLTVTVHGANDAPTAASFVDTSVVEDGGVASGTAAHATDPDSAIAHYTLTSDVDTGTLVFNPDGTWTYDPQAFFQNLSVGDTRDITFQYTATDAQGLTSDPATVTIRIAGANDAPVVDHNIVYQQTNEGSLFEFQIPEDTFTDVDAHDTLTYTATLADVDPDTMERLPLPAWLSISDTGKFSGTPSNADLAEFVLPGETYGELFIRVDVSDGHGGTTYDYFKLTVYNTNDAPVITMDAANVGSVTAAGHTDAGAAVAGSPTSSGDLSATDPDSVVDPANSAAWSIDGVAVGGAIQGTYGHISIDAATGVWTYTLDNALAATKALAEGESQTDTFTARVTDNTGLSGTRSIVVTVNGTNNLPVVTNVASDLAGSVTEAGHLDDGTAVAGVPSATGTLAASDVDNGATKAWSLQGTVDATYGSMAIDPATGVWTYTLDNDLAATQALKEGEVVTLHYTARVTDDFGAYVDQTVAVTITGTNDVPVVTNDVAAGAGSVTESGHLDDGTVVAGTASATGTLAASDVDNGATQAWSLEGSNDATYGSMVLDADTGVWTYTLDNSLVATQALAEGDSVTLNYTARVTDEFGAYADQTISVTINGTNDLPVVTNAASDLAGSVTEAGHLDDGTVVVGAPSATGALAASDVDNGATQAWSLQGTVDATYGSMAIDPATGVWTYTLDNDLAATQALKEGEVVTLHYTARVTDDFGAYVDQTVAVTITGTNDVPVVTNDVAAGAGSVTESGHLDDGTVVAGTVSATGTLAASDVDAGAAHTWSLEGPVDATYGSMVLDADTGVWTYALDNSLAATQALEEGQSVELTYTARVTDEFGAYADQTITVTVNGTNDKPVVTNEPAALVGSVTEAGHLDDGTVVAGTAVATGTLSASDVDSGATRTWSLQGTPDTTYGSLAIDAATGVWTYTLDNTKAATQALAEGDEVPLSFVARVTDDKGAYVDQTINLTIHGSNDLPFVNNLNNLAFVEDSAGSHNVVKPFGDIDVGAHLTYSLAYYAADGVTPLAGKPSWLTVTSSNLGDAGLDNDTFVFSGTPTNSNVGNVVVRMTATDDKGAALTSSFTISVANTNDVPYLVHTLPDKVVAQHSAFSYTVPSHSNAATRIFYDVDLPYGDTLTYSATLATGEALPAWLHFDAATRTFSGTPDAAATVGSIDVRVSATDSAGASVFDVMKITVTNVDDAPAALDPTKDIVGIAGTVSEGHTLSVDTTNLVDDDGIGAGALNYQWQKLVGGVWTDIGGATASTYALTNAMAKAGDVLRVTVSYTDLGGFSNSVSSAATTPVALVDEAPTGFSTIVNATDAGRGVASAQQNDVLSVPVDLADADGLTAPGTTYQWLRDGVAISEATGSTYALVQADVGHTISVRASYVDDDGFHDSITSAETNAIVNVNDAPTVTAALTSAADEGD